MCVTGCLQCRGHSLRAVIEQAYSTRAVSIIIETANLNMQRSMNDKQTNTPKSWVRATNLLLDLGSQNWLISNIFHYQ